MRIVEKAQKTEENSMEIAVLRICFFPEKVVRCQAIFPNNFF